MATKRTTHRSTTGKKLYAVRNEKGEFEDIQTYKRAHSADLRKTHTKNDQPAAKKAAPKKAAKKAAPKKAAKKAAPKKAAKKAAPKKAAKKAAPKKKK